MGKQLVAKRFFKLQESKDIMAFLDTKVSVSESRVEVEGEGMRLAQCQWFLAIFYQLCGKKSGVSVYENLTIADALLAQEIDGNSIASGLNSESDDSDSTGMTWLVEQKRLHALIKFSGTLQHRILQKGLQTLTVHAFSHFVYGYSKETMVVADLQGTPAQVKGKDGLVLFDVMTHTINGESGIGDFGIEGMVSFLKDHECLDVCHGLGLDKSMPIDVNVFQANVWDKDKESMPEDDDEPVLPVHT
ncbi:hypothetical protein H0H87_005060 [Tephrocybe sp. NHM501043]|nr:hypothetical protein H0H87_005060 [Tephrocybe sp. NHM501043]